MDIIEYISPFEYIGSSLGKINQNFTNLQQLPVTLSAKYIQIDNFITSLRSQIVTDTAIVSGNASVRDTFRAEGPVVLGSETRAEEDVIIYSWPITLYNATQTARALQFGSADFANLYQSAALTLKTDSNFIVDLDTTFGNNATRTTTINSGNINLVNATSNTQSLNFGSTTPPKLYRGGANLLDLEGSLETTQSVYVSGGVQSVNDLNTTRNLNVSGAVQIGSTVRANIGSGGDTNDVVVKRAANQLETRTVDSRVWGSSLASGTGTSNTVPKYTGTNTIGNSNISDTGSVITLNGQLVFKNGIAAGANALASGTVTIANVTGATTNSIAIATVRSIAGNGAVTCRYRATPGTNNLTITALLSSGSTNTGDTSTISWMLVNTVA
jgi:hypothetical protein